MRVMVYCAALGGAIGVCLAFVAERIADQYEHILIREEMEAELDAQIALHANHPEDGRLARGDWKSVYIDRPGQAPTSPPELRNLVPGIHDIGDAGHERFVGIRAAPPGRFTIVRGLPTSPARERRLTEELLAMIALGIVLGAWLGRMLASGMLSPVLRLSRQMDRADPGEELHGIADDHRSDEVGALANAFIRYQVRVNAAIEREVLFSADAGHELRTPLSVLGGALDLLDAQTVQAPARRRIERMRRSATEIAILLDALLLMARPEESQDAAPRTVDVGATLAAVIAEYRDELAAAGIAIGVRCAPDAVIQAPSELLRTVLRLLFRSIAGGAWGEHLKLDVDAAAITLSTSDPTAMDPDGSDPAQATASAAATGDANTTPARRSDESGGIGMLRRLCGRYGWTLATADTPDQAFLLRIAMAPTGPGH